MRTANVTPMLLVLVSLLTAEGSGGGLPGENFCSLSQQTLRTSLLLPFLFGEKALGKLLPKVRLEILKRERLRINVYGLLAMYSEPCKVGSVIRILSEKSQDTSCGGGNEA